MPYVYPGAASLHGKPKVDGECVALVRHYAGAPPTRYWRQGEEVFGNRMLRPGTAIATFENGRWPGKAKGNHAAFYLSQTSTGIWVVDQWNLDTAKRTISRRFIIRREIYDDGTYERPSDNAFAFSVIK
jgi:hypothetical protein